MKMYSDVLALMSVGGIGPVTYHHLISRFKKPERVFGQTRRNLLECPGVTQQMADEIITGQFRNVYRNQLAWIKRHNARVLTLYDGEYPVILKQIFDPPPMLMIIGEIYPDDDFSLAVVGTRNPDDYGKRCADRITTGIVKAGITVVSGLARGIDAAAHHAALKRGGRTLAVLGTGLDRQYPQENSALYRQIPKNGAIISENCIGMRQKPGNFVRRNRIISGLSRGVVVVQAGHRSGAVTTALFANEQNR